MRTSGIQHALSRLAALVAMCGALALLPAQQPRAFSQAPAADVMVYAEALASGWAD